MISDKSAKMLKDLVDYAMYCGSLRAINKLTKMEKNSLRVKVLNVAQLIDKYEASTATASSPLLVERKLSVEEGGDESKFTPEGIRSDVDKKGLHRVSKNTSK